MLLGQNFEILHKLSLLERNISYSEIPSIFLNDFQEFNFGATIYKNKEGEFCVSSGDFYAWYNKIIIDGFDTQIILDEESTSIIK